MSNLKILSDVECNRKSLDSSTKKDNCKNIEESPRKSSSQEDELPMSVASFMM